MIKPHFYRRLSQLFLSAGSRLSRIFRGRLAGLAQIAAGGRLSRRLGGLYTYHVIVDFVTLQFLQFLLNYFSA